MLLFKKIFLDLIRSGEKTQTVRIWPRRMYRTGQRSYIPGVGYIQILDVAAVPLEAITEEDAQLDGFPNLASLLEEIRRIYPDGLTGGQQSFRVRFRVLSPEEQAAAVEEKQARKRNQQAAKPDEPRDS